MTMKPTGRCLILIFVLKCVMTVVIGTRITKGSRLQTFAQLKEVGAEKLVIKLTKPKLANFKGYFIQVQTVDGLKFTSTREMYLGVSAETAHVGHLKPLTTYRISVWTRVRNEKTNRITFDAATRGLQEQTSASTSTTVTSSWNMLLMLASLRVAQHIQCL